MSRYRKIDPRIWNDEKIRTFSDDGKLAFLYVLTHPHLTALGAMRATLDGLAAELLWKPKRLRAALSPAIHAGMVEVNEVAAYVGLPRFLRYNEPEGPNSVKKAWLAALDLIPECEEKRALILRCRKYLDGQSPAFRDAIGDAIWDVYPDTITDAYRDASPIQEQEQEQEPPPLTPPPSLDGWPSPEALARLYNKLVPNGHPRVAKLTTGRRKKALEALRQFPDEAFWRSALGEIAQSALLQGLRHSAGHEHFRADFDWLLARGKDGVENIVKVAEGKYRDRPIDEDDAEE